MGSSQFLIYVFQKRLQFFFKAHKLLLQSNTQVNKLGCLLLRLWTISPSFSSPTCNCHTVPMWCWAQPLEHAQWGLRWNKPHAVGSGHVSKARESLLAPTEFKSGHQRRYTYLRCRSQKAPRPAPLLVLAQHGAHAAPHCLGSRLTSEPEGIICLHAFLPESPFSCLFCYQEVSKIFFELLFIVTFL